MSEKQEKLLPMPSENGSYVEYYLKAVQNGLISSSVPSDIDPVDMMYKIIKELHENRIMPLLVVKVPEKIWKSGGFNQTANQLMSALQKSGRIVLCIPNFTDTYAFEQFDVKDIKEVDMSKLQKDIYDDFMTQISKQEAEK